MASVAGPVCHLALMSRSKDLGPECSDHCAIWAIVLVKTVVKNQSARSTAPFGQLCSLRQ